MEIEGFIHSYLMKIGKYWRFIELQEFQSIPLFGKNQSRKYFHFALKDFNYSFFAKKVLYVDIHITEVN